MKDRMTVILILITWILLVLTSGKNAFAQKLQSRETLRDSIAESPDSSNYDFDFSTRLRHFQSQTSIERNNTLDAKISSQFKYWPTEKQDPFYLHFSPFINHRSGFKQTYEDDQESKNKIGLSEASLNIKTENNLLNHRLNIGALDQKNTYPGILIEDQTFAGIRYSPSISINRNNSLELKAQHAIPTSSSLSSQTRDSEPTPTFTSVSTGWIGRYSKITTNIDVGIFEFNNLTISMANDAGMKGNSISPLPGLDNQFKYSFKGYYSRLDGKFSIFRSHTIGAQLGYVKNEKAPQSQSLGQSLKLFSNHPVSKTTQISPYFSYFKVEQDAAVASLNSEWAQTNRNGYNYGADLIYKNKVKFGAIYGERDALIQSPFIEREQRFSIYMETSYVGF